jgi:hypothetical protein
VGAQIADANVSLVFPVTQFLQFTGEYTYTVPSLALPYSSILWVFADSSQQFAGVSARVGLGAFQVKVPLDFDVGYRHIFDVWTPRAAPTPRATATSCAPPGGPPRTPRWAPRDRASSCPRRATGRRGPSAR